MSEVLAFLRIWFVGFNFILCNLAVDAVVSALRHFGFSGSAAGFGAFDDLVVTDTNRTWEGEGHYRTL